MKNSFYLFIKVIFPLLILAACTRFLDEAEPTIESKSTDGCVYCHTNKARLQVLAQADETGAAGGG